MKGRSVHIHYRRLPERVELFEQGVVAEIDGCTVTLLESATVQRPILIDGRVVLEPGSPVVWFTYPGRWHDIGRFHRTDGTFTGVYANVLTPVQVVGDRWDTTDLCLDVWAGADGTIAVLDEDELATALREGWVDQEVARRARREAAAITRAARRGEWPPPEVLEWTLERARKEA